MGNVSDAGATGHSGPVFVAADAVGSLICWQEAVDCLRRVYAEPVDPAASPPRVVARGRGVALRALVAAPPALRFMGAKVFGRGRNRGVEYTIILIEQETGRVAAIVDGNPVTALRTAATSALAVEQMTAADMPLVVGMLGSGMEARAHLKAVAAVRPLREVRVFSPNPDKRAAFAQDMEAELSLSCTVASDGASALAGADLAIAAARSYDETPILLGEWLRPGMAVVSIGSTLPEQREADTDAIAAADPILCDMPEEVGAASGDMIAAREAGVEVDYKLLSLNDVVSGAMSLRRSETSIPMFKSVGAAIQDVAMAELAYERAVAAGRATPLSIEFLTKS